MAPAPGAKQVWVEGDIHRSIKVEAANTGRDIQDVVNSVLKAHVEQTQHIASSSKREPEPALST